ncbi:hypothetical protein COEREDRAFT_82130 [Coemansia reversa NRRL 1564]|uniref:HMG box domain-containing protein n=1 Tax=Coemansia reversa (strain ATCC 12441 / NRRL 1564) TaxID=763665 RepID=A0A2G5B821_COERN|nr:hypothetical protein COEREDRAFT_82130 [Coemansia reversa NRRL 1564]|eukprot:PIA15141.1 hypothetical protein COEREDRAFT_82130 [Coemansia reversa NRRL 1564]
MFAQELEGLALAPRPVSANSPPPNILVNRVPQGFTPILIDLQRCSRAELRKFLHKMLCNPQIDAEDNGDTPKERPLGRCGCELLEFDYQPDFLFGKRKNCDSRDVDSSNADETSHSTSSDDGSADNDGEKSENDSDGNCTKSKNSLQTQVEGREIKIKRPPNSFMLYRSQRHKELVKQYKGGNKVVSGIIAKEWNSMTPDLKREYEDMAAMRKREHELLYPNYKFVPKRRRA